MGDMQALKVVLDLVTDPNAVKKTLDQLIEATAELHEKLQELSRKEAAQVAEYAARGKAADEAIAAKTQELADLESKIAGVKQKLAAFLA